MPRAAIFDAFITTVLALFVVLVISMLPLDSRGRMSGLFNTLATSASSKLEEFNGMTVVVLVELEVTVVDVEVVVAASNEYDMLMEPPANNVPFDGFGRYVLFAKTTGETPNE